MYSYLSLIEEIMSKGKKKENRTGVPAISIHGAMFRHDMKDGFPAVTTKKLSFKTMLVELEGFIKGVRDKNWYRERGCHIWDEWGNPERIKAKLNGSTSVIERKKLQLEEVDLGAIYGVQWRNFGESNKPEGDQLKRLVDTLKKDPNDRRMMVSAWNPLDLGRMALPPCHFAFHVVVIGDELNLTWFQRSCDVMLGLPFNIASYGAMLHLLAKETGLKEGGLCGMLSDVHIYENHLEGAKEQLKRKPFPLPKIETTNFDNFFSWEQPQTRLLDYNFHPRIAFEVAV